jgi:hypothetical protein
MPRKKKTKSKRTTSKIATTKRAKRSSAGKQTRLRTKTVKKKQSKNKKQSSSKKSPSRKRTARRSIAQQSRPSRGREGAFDLQSGDLEGLSRAEQADSQSVDELVEEGNVFEAGAVAGVEAADDEETKEVHTREFPEDDVPDEYLDKD